MNAFIHSNLRILSQIAVTKLVLTNAKAVVIQHAKMAFTPPSLRTSMSCGFPSCVSWADRYEFVKSLNLEIVGAGNFRWELRALYEQCNRNVTVTKGSGHGQLLHSCLPHLFWPVKKAEHPHTAYLNIILYPMAWILVPVVCTINSMQFTYCPLPFLGFIMPDDAPMSTRNVSLSPAISWYNSKWSIDSSPHMAAIT
jgi:hypothetical protein